MVKQTARSCARLLGYGRIALGVGAVAMPFVPSLPWVGADAARQPAVRLFARALGGRDLALGMGLVLAMARDAPVRGWVEAGGLVDVGDLAVTLVSFRTLPRWTRWGIVALTGASAAVSGLIVASVD